MRDASGDWASAVFLDAAIILISFVLLLFVRENKQPLTGAAR